MQEWLGWGMDGWLGVWFFVPRDFFEASPDSDVLLQLVLHLLPEVVLPLSDLPPQLPLNSLQLLFVARLKHPLLLLK